MKAQRVSLVLVGTMIGAVATAYLLAQVVVQKFTASGKVSVANECSAGNTDTLQKQNANSALFVSCGGFIE